jgi:Uma2 family endonuclease
MLAAMPTARITFDDLAASADLASQFRSPAVELIDGRLVRHALPSAAVVAAVVRLASAFDDLAAGLRIGVRDAVAAPPCDLLRPDVSVARPTASYARWPAPPAYALALAVLVVDGVDEEPERLRRYALAGVREVWVVDALAATGTRYAVPHGGRYTRRELLLPGEPCAPDEAPWLQVVPVPRERPITGRDQASSSSISNDSPSTSITSPGASRRLRRVST